VLALSFVGGAPDHLPSRLNVNRRCLAEVS
jgi:hypothetical protein